VLLTTRSSYGVRGLIHLAIAHKKEDGRPVSAGRVSREEGISNTYLEQIFNRLKARGIVKSVRGPGGGYVLARDPSKISVYEVVMVLEGGISPGKCVGNRKICTKAGRCASKEVWEEVAKQITGTLESFSLGDLAARALEMDPEKNAKGLRVK